MSHNRAKMADSSFALTCFGIFFTTLLARFLGDRRQLPQTPPQENGAIKGYGTNLHPAQGDTSLLSAIFRVGLWVVESRPVRKIKTRITGRPHYALERAYQNDDISSGRASSETTSSTLSSPETMAPPATRSRTKALASTSAPVEIPKDGPSSVDPANAPHRPKTSLSGTKESSSSKLEGSLSTPPLASPSNTPPLPYQAVRVIFLGWDSERSLNTPCNELMDKLRHLLGMIYHFSIHEFTIPTTPRPETIDTLFLRYLLANKFLSLTSPDHDRELVIIIYSGSGAQINGQYHLITSTTGNPSSPRQQQKPHPNLGLVKMPIDWLENRLAAAPYDSLMILNSTYYPKLITAGTIRGTNLVLAAAGPDGNFSRGLPAELRFLTTKTTTTAKGKAKEVPWAVGFLETLVEELEKVAEETESVSATAVSVRDLYWRLYVEHQGKWGGSGSGGSMRPYLDLFYDVDGGCELGMIEIGRLPGVGDCEKVQGGQGINDEVESGWTLVSWSDREMLLRDWLEPSVFRR